MAINPRWRQPLRQWRQQFTSWLTEPVPDGDLAAPASSSTCDRCTATRPCTPGCSGRARAASAVRAGVPRAPGQAGRRARAAARLLPRPRAGEGEASTATRSTSSGAASAPSSSWRASTPSSAGSSRREHAGAAPRPPPTAGSRRRSAPHDLQDAFEFVSYLRLRHQAQQVRPEQEPDNHLGPDDLLSRPTSGTCATRSRIVRSAQTALCARYPTLYYSPDPPCCAASSLARPRRRALERAAPGPAARLPGGAAAGPRRRHRPSCPCSPSTSRRRAWTRARDRVLSIGWVPVDGRGVVLAGARYRVVRPEGDDAVGPSATVHGLTDDEARGRGPAGRRRRGAAGRPGGSRPARALRAHRDRVPRARVRAVVGRRAALAGRRHARAGAPRSSRPPGSPIRPPVHCGCGRRGSGTACPAPARTTPSPTPSPAPSSTSPRRAELADGRPLPLRRLLAR